jgi:glycosyltransferase involved in cell wall biosynthesis
MRIVYLCHYFVPEISAPSARLYEMSRAWVERGHTVTVMTGFPNHPTGIIPKEYRWRLWATEAIDGIRVLRNWLYATPNEGFVRKSISHLTFMVSSVLFGLPRLGPADVIIASSPTFFAVFSAYFISRLRGIPYIFEVRDLWPAVFVDLGVIRNRTVIRLLENAEMFLYQNAAKVVTVTDAFTNTLVKRGLPPDKVMKITNGADLEFFQPPGEGEGRSQKREGAVSNPQPSTRNSSPFTVLYMGAHGISHGLDSILRAAERLRDHPEIEFLFVGEGAEKKNLIALKEELGLRNVRFVPGQAKAGVRAFYHTASVGLVPLRDVPLFSGFIPSKMFELMACGVPIVGSVRGEPARILEESGSALLVPPEDPAALAEAILALYADPDRRRQMSAAGRAFVEAHYDRRKLAVQYEELLRQVATQAASNDPRV